MIIYWPNPSNPWSFPGQNHDRNRRGRGTEKKLSLTCLSLTVLLLLFSSIPASSAEGKNNSEVPSLNREMGLLKSSGLVWIKLYQKVISSQDFSSCNFAPSCSQFAVRSIQDLGLFRGVLLAADRLMRCNYCIKPGYYRFDGRKYVDPLQNYYTP